MARGLAAIEIPFPKGLTNTSESANLNPNKYARRIVNMLPSDNTAGSGVPRYGFEDKFNEITEGTVLDYFEYRKADGTQEILAWVDETTKHTIRKFAADGTYSLLKDNLDSTGFLRCEVFNSVLCFCNGVDDNFYYDGSAVTDMEEEVEEGGAFASSIVDYVSSDTVTVQAGEDLTSRYTVGAYIRITWDGGELENTVASSSYDSGTGKTTIQINSGTITASAAPYQVFYKDKPRPFSYLKAHKNYLLALSGGVMKAKDFRGEDGLTVYSTDRPNNQNAWFNAETQSEPYLNCADHHDFNDEFHAIQELEGVAVFLGRKGMQIWNVTDFTSVGGVSFSKFINVGLVNPNLTQNFPSDVLIMTSYGARSLRNVFQTEGLEVTTDLGTNIDGDITTEVRKMQASDAVYKAARSVFYEEGGFYGFRMNDDTYVYSLSEQSKGWVVFDGYFKSFDAIKSFSDGRLFISRGGQAYVYLNGNDDVHTNVGFEDNGNGYECIWWTKWFRFKQRWANRYFTLILEDSDATEITVERYLDNNDDVGKAITFVVDATSPTWDESYWDEEFWSLADKQPRRRDKFLCDSMSLLVKFNTSGGQATILGIKAEGS